MAKIVMGLKNLKKQKNPSVISIGVFDGVHKGHQKILKYIAKKAKKENIRSVVITFDPHPLDVLKPKKFPTILTSLPLKLKLIEELGVDLIIVIKFNKSFSNIRPENFVKETLVEKLNIKSLTVGERFTFGKDRKGNINFLRQLGLKYGYKLNVASKVHDAAGHKISSTLIRNLIHGGNLKKSAKLLGRYPVFIGKVACGHGRGNITGYPTANLITKDKASIPKKGVYIGNVSTGKINRLSVINIGKSPTFKDKQNKIEAHIIDFNKELYGKEIAVTLIERIRDISKFKSPEKLSAQIEKDINKAKMYKFN